VIAALDPDFKTSGVYSRELRQYRVALKDHIARMQDGVSCGWQSQGSNDIRVACADIHTGLASLATLKDPTNYFPCFRYNAQTGQVWTDPHCFAAEDAKWRHFEQAQLNPTREQLQREVLAQLPLFEMQALADQLYMYSDDPQELTTYKNRIQTGGDAQLCVDVQWGIRDAGTPVWLWPCNGGEAQRWHYDRKSGLIRNTAFDKCLDVKWGQLVDDVPVWIWDCTGSDAQRWTWDPESSVLQNALGTVLDARVYLGSTGAAQSPLETGYRSDGAPFQTWYEGFISSDFVLPKPCFDFNCSADPFRL
jgi:hypothetical protein